MIDRRHLLASALGAAAVGAALDSGPAVAGPRGVTADSPATVVKRRLEAQKEAWNRGDLEAFCADYADDAVFLSPSGLTRGRAEVLARYKKKYGSAHETLGTLSFEFLDERASAELVTLALRWKLSWTGKPEAAGLTLITWQKIKGDWQLVQDASL